MATTGAAFRGNTGTAEELPGFSRVWASTIGDTPRLGSVGMEFRFARNDVDGCFPSMVQGFAALVGVPGDTIIVQADLGSYRLRPKCGVKLVGDATNDWNVVLFRCNDPSFEQDTLWKTLLVPTGAWQPPAFYHLLRILAGNLQWNGLTIERGFEFSLAPAQYSALSDCVIQVGFKI